LAPFEISGPTTTGPLRELFSTIAKHRCQLFELARQKQACLDKDAPTPSVQPPAHAPEADGFADFLSSLGQDMLDDIDFMGGWNESDFAPIHEQGMPWTD
jgi:hypothetical protein